MIYVLNINVILVYINVYTSDMVYHGATADVSRILPKNLGPWNSCEVSDILLGARFLFSSATLWYICIQYDNAHNNYSEGQQWFWSHGKASSWHGTTVCLFVETEDRDPQKKTHGSGWNIKLPFSATETKHTILGWPMDVPQLPCFTWLHPWHKVPNSKSIKPSRLCESP